MPTSKTEICNMALAHIGVSKAVQDVDTESSTEARACRLFFDHAVRTILEAKPWGFASSQVALVQQTNDRSDAWGYKYAVPTFVRRINHIVNPATRTPGQGNEVPFKVARNESAFGKCIYTDEEGAILDYNYDVDDVNLFPATFVHALSLFLAASIAQPLRVNASIQQEVQRLYMAWNSEAMTRDMEEGQEDVEPASEFQTVRG